MRGDFILVIGNDPVGLGIRTAEFLNGKRKMRKTLFPKYSHAAILIDDGNDENAQIIEAEPGGARIGHAGEYGKPGIGWIKSSWNLDDNTRDRIVLEQKLLLNTPYSALDYGSLALLHFHIRPEFVVNYVANSGHMICSQMVDEVYKRAGLQMFSDGRFPGDVTPEDLESVLTGPQKR